MKKITQFVAHLSAGDAISGQVLALEEIFNKLGWQTQIISRYIDKQGLPGRAREFRPELKISPDELVVFHLSDYTEISKFIKVLPNKKILIYHNITPAHFFRGLDKKAQANSALGRWWLKKMAGDFDLALGVSEFNRSELVMLGYKNTGVLPLVFDPKKYQKKSPVPPKLPGLIQFLTVGRMAPNKKIEDVIKTFYFFHRYINNNSRLMVAGLAYKEFLKYSEFIKALIQRLGLGQQVIFTGLLGQAALNGLYAESEFYLALSEHEGFCLPILEAFYFGLPVIARNIGGMPDTLGPAGIKVDRENPAELAEIMAVVLNNRNLLGQIIFLQKEQVEKFSPGKIAGLLERYLEQINV